MSKAAVAAGADAIGFVFYEKKSPLCDAGARGRVGAPASAPFLTPVACSSTPATRNWPRAWRGAAEYADPVSSNT